MKQTLYSCKAEINGDGQTNYRISKFVDGDLESSYLTTLTECECPAGHRPSCRHRQMLPMMLVHDIVNTHWFWDFDLNRVVDFSGELKSNLDALNELAIQTDADGLELDEEDEDEIGLRIEAMSDGCKSLSEPDSTDAVGTTLIKRAEIEREVQAAEYHASFAKGNWRRI